MAQSVGFLPAPADVPGPRTTITAIPTTPSAATPGFGPTTANNPSPIVINRAPSETHSDTERSSSRTAHHLKAATDKVIYYGHKYRWEAAPAATIGALNTLGWWMNTEPHAGLMAVGAAGLAVGSGFAGVHGLKHQHQRLFGAAAGVSAALANVTAATGFGFGPVSFTVAAITTALGYVAYVPWLIRHRRERDKDDEKQGKKVERQDATPVQNNEPAALDVDGDVYLPATAPAMPVHNPFHDDIIPYAVDPDRNVKTPIRIGWDETGKATLMTLLYRHTLVAGASDWGKSGIINLIIKRLTGKDHVDLYGIDLKPGAPELGPWAPLFKRLARTPEEARELFDELEAIAKRRGAHLEDISAKALAVGEPPVRKWIPGDPNAPMDSPDWGHGTAIFTITDELGELIRQDEVLRKAEAEMRRADPEFGPPAEVPLPTRYESGLAVWRFLAMQFVSATQQPSSRIFGGSTDARGNYGNRISTRMGEAGHSRFIFGEGCKGNGFTPETLKRPGEFFFAAAEQPQVNPPRHRSEFVSDKDIAVAVAPYHQAVPDEPVRPAIRLVKAAQQPAPVRPEMPKVLFPDGSEVGRGSEGWLDLYLVFRELCAEHGYATKDMLIEHGPYGSRDTARRALEFWLARGVQVRKAGRTDQFFLPEPAGRQGES